MKADSFKIKNRSGREIFSITPEVARTKFRALKLDGRAQALTSLQAEQILSLPSTNMRIASLTKNLQISSASHLDLMTSIGNMSLRALKNLILEAEKVWILPMKISKYINDQIDKVPIWFQLQIGVDSQNVFVPKLNGLTQNSSMIFEICVCTDGSMFAAEVNRGCYDSGREFGHCPSSWTILR